MNLEALRTEITLQQKKGLPFIITSAILWGLITIVTALQLPITTQNILVFCCSGFLMPIAYQVGKKLNINVFAKQNELGQLGTLFTMNQALYMLIVMWVYAAVPEKMVMVYAMVFGAHLLPYSWLYKSIGYKIFAVAIPIIALALGNFFNSFAVALAMTIIEVLFTITLFIETKRVTKSIT